MICRVKKILRRLIFAFAALGAMGVTLAHAVPVYTITNLGQFTASALNDNNQVTGTRNNRAVIWDATNGLTDLGTLGGSYGFGSDINNMGQVIGSSETSTGERHAFVSDSTTNALTDLGTLGGTESDGAAINDNGQVTGSSTTSNGNLNVFIWDAINGFTDLGNLGNASGVVGGTDINEMGQITGLAGHGGFIGDINGLTPLSNNAVTFPLAINDLGQVTGYRVNPTVKSFVWDSGNGFTDLPGDGNTPGNDGIANDINNAGQVVGGEGFSGGRGFLWENGIIYNLNDLIDLNDPLFGTFSLFDAVGINNFGNIVATGQLNGVGHSFLLTAQSSAPQAVPEPSAFLLMLMGLMLLGLVRCSGTGKKCGDRGRALKYPVEMGYSILMNLINNNGE